MKRFMKAACLLLAMLLLCACTAPAEPTVPETTQIVPTTELATVPTTEPTEPPLVLHSGLREDGSFDEGTWFIGDSMTCILVEDYLEPEGFLGDANYTGKYGAQITAFFDGTVMDPKAIGRCVCRPEHEKLRYEDVAVELGEQATAIYIMFGTNYTWNAYADAYIELTDFLLETCPNATVHLQLIPWGSGKNIKFDRVNEWVREAYAHYQEKGEQRVFLIDTFTAIGRNTDKGYIHLNKQGNENWYNAIVAHAEENNLSQ